MTLDHVGPEWDEFPNNTAIDVFDAYGPSNTGFPTAFSPCGNNPIVIDYVDEVVLGQCFAETLIHRKFRAIDNCGKEITRVQVS